MRAVALLALAWGCDRPVDPKPVASPPPTAGRPAYGAVSGRVMFSGIPPREHYGPEPQVKVDLSKAKSLQVSEDGALTNVYVVVEAGLSGSYPTPSEPVRLNQVGLLYEPRVVGVMKDQLLIVRNCDQSMHNVHFKPVKNPEFNLGQKNRGDEDSFKFSIAERAIPIRCDVHPWMIGWLHVSDHPYFAVTGIDGRYQIDNLLSGEYEILAWHERFKDKPLVAKVKVEPGKVAALDFTFEGR